MMGSSQSYLTCSLRMEISFKFCLSHCNSVLFALTDSHSFDVVTCALYRLFWYRQEKLDKKIPLNILTGSIKGNCIMNELPKIKMSGNCKHNSYINHHIAKSGQNLVLTLFRYPKMA